MYLLIPLICVAINILYIYDIIHVSYVYYIYSPTTSNAIGTNAQVHLKFQMFLECHLECWDDVDFKFGDKVMIFGIASSQQTVSCNSILLIGQIRYLTLFRNKHPIFTHGYNHCQPYTPCNKKKKHFLFWISYYRILHIHHCSSHLHPIYILHY